MASLDDASGLPARDRTLSVLVVHEEMPTYDRQSGSLRLQRYVEVMVAEGHRVTYLARAGFGQERYVEELRAIGVEVHAVDARRLRAAGHAVPGLGVDLRLLLARQRFDLAYLNFYGTAEQYLPDIRAHSPATRILIDTHDVHYLRERRGAELSGDPAALAAAESTREREAAIYSLADLLTAVSQDDADALRELAPDVPVEIVTNVHVAVPAGPPFAQRSGLVFVANFDHAPNVDAILDFHAESWPHIARAVPGAHLMIVGYAPPPSVRALHGDRITVTGQVPEVAPYLDAARLSIAPLRYGAGVKGKIGEALMHGLPVVTTPIGAEGMGLIDGEHALIAESGEEFARAVVRLYDDAALWERMAVAGKAHVEDRHSVDAAVASLRRAFASAVPACFIARVSPWSPDAAARVVRGYVSAFAEDDAVTLVVPVTPADPEPDAVCAVLAEAIAQAGADPEHVPDIAVMPCAETPPVPSCAVVVDPSTGLPSDWGAAAVDAAGVAGGGAAPDGDGSRPRVSIIIPAYGRREMTEKCLAALDRELGDRLGPEIELVLVDNASPDTTLELFAQWSARATVVALPQNLNFAGGVNAGARVARGQVLMVVSTDMELGPGAVDRLVEEVLKPGVGLVGARMRYPDGRLQHGGIGWRRGSYGMLPFHLFHYEPATQPLAQATLEIGSVTGGCIAVRADLFALVGGFDEGYVNGWEDADLCLQIRSTGAGVRYRGDVDILHHEGATSGGSYNGQDNPRRFDARWAMMLTDDTPLMRDVLGAGLSPIIDLPVPDDRPDGAGVRVVGSVAGVGPRAGEARGILHALRHAGVDVAARTVAPTWIGPAIDEARWRELAAAHARPAASGAVTVSFGELEDDGAAAEILRVGQTIPPHRPGTVAWAPSPEIADALAREGWPAEAIALVAPAGIESGRGDGGAGILVLAPTHDARLTAGLVADLSHWGLAPVRVLPSVRTPEIRGALLAARPDAELLAPVTDERALAALAAASDLVIAVDRADDFDRLALTAAASGAAVAVRAGGPAAWVLGDLALTVDPARPEAIGDAVRARGWDPSADARRARSAAVLSACGTSASASALRALLPVPAIR
ncbi:MAG TPA: glycosyltransferase [Solirubrobacteraceae bacterium]|jgi:GT2 family glycosyltransferase/glycosyltransferase involved in cell wall biosynthesis|nr:glycosyltransferase [Solirubrobacteraceae bacterium]